MSEKPEKRAFFERSRKQVSDTDAAPQTIWDLEVDPELYEKGIRVDVRGSTFFVRHSGDDNVAFKNALGQAILKVKGARELFLDVSKEENQLKIAQLEPKVTAEAMYGAVVIGWENVRDRKGNDIPFNRENFIDLMRRIPSLLAHIRRTSEDFSLYRSQQVEEAAANLGKPSSGDESGENG